MVRQASVADLSLPDQILHRPPRLLYGGARVRVVELQQVDMICLQAAKACFYLPPRAFRSEIFHRASFSIWQGPALCEDENVVPSTFDSFAHNLLCPSPPVEACGINPVHAEVQGRPDSANS